MGDPNGVTSGNDRRRLRRVWSMAVVVSLVVAFGVVIWRQQRPQPATVESLLESARQALREGDYSEARRLSREILDSDPASIGAALTGARAAARLEDWQAAVDFHDHLPDSPSPTILKAHTESARIVLFELNRASEAEQRLLRILEADPHQTDANIYFIGMCAMTGRAVEAEPHIRELLNQGVFSTDHLLFLSSPWASLKNRELLRQCGGEHSRDPIVLLGEGILASADRRHDAAVRLFRQAIQLDQGLLEARVRLGREILRQGAGDAFLEWHRDLPADAEQSARIWFLRGQWAEAHSQPEPAMRCYWESLRRDPRMRDSAYRLGRLLLSREGEQVATPILQHAKLLEELRPADASQTADQGNLRPLRNTVETLLRLGRKLEAWAWCDIISRMRPDQFWFAERRIELAAARSDGAIDRFQGVNPARNLDFSRLPLPDWTQDVNSDTSHNNAQLTGSRIHFVDEAASAGIAFTWHHTGDPVAGLRMYEFTGGGVGVIDYDSDFWPDLYFTQATDHPESRNSPHIDRLFQNVSGRRFRDVTQSARLAEDRFSQGVTVGDYDSDGFSDLYIANIGVNRLFRNNGDGTFSESVMEASSSAWTTSCCLVDLNDDGHPDLYDVNYLDGDDILEKVCRFHSRPVGLCLPDVFEAADDQVSVNRGDGSFADLTDEMGFRRPNGKGLGILAGRSLADREMFLFIANDAVANFYYERNPLPKDGPLRFVERAVLAGVAFNGRGETEGCMGVAAADADGDERLDLFVTNFLRESNTLYLGQDQHQFIDATRTADLAATSLPTTGFGTQFLDADLDGRPDLVVANGHVDDLRTDESPYAMRPQVYWNLGDRRFAELAPETVGDYFRQQHVGRGLARLDWNRDQLDDFAVTHLTTPAGLVTNRSAVDAHSIGILLCGAQYRDGRTSSVAVSAGERRWRRQLTAGDGYQACNDRVLVFGLGEYPRVDELHLEWPNGETQRFTDLAADVWYIVCEHNGRLLRAPDGQPRRHPVPDP